MLRHVVMFSWKEEAAEADRLAVAEGLSRLPDCIPQIRRYEFGSDLGLAEGNFDFVVVADFDSQSDYEAYQSHPDHLEVVHEAIRPHVARRAAIQVSLD